MFLFSYLSIFFSRPLIIYGAHSCGLCSWWLAITHIIVNMAEKTSGMGISSIGNDNQDEQRGELSYDLYPKPVFTID